MPAASLTEKTLAEFARRHAENPRRRHTTDDIARAVGAHISSMQMTCSKLARNNLLDRTPRNGRWRLYWITPAGLERARLGNAQACRESMLDACAALTRLLGYRAPTRPAAGARVITFTTPGDLHP